MFVVVILLLFLLLLDSFENNINTNIILGAWCFGRSFGFTRWLEWWSQMSLLMKLFWRSR